MIERLFKHDLSLKRYRRFKNRTSACVSAVILLFMVLLTFMAPMLANNKPLILKYNASWYLPIFKDYPAEIFDQQGSLYVDYRALDMKDGDTMIWPPIQWNPYESNKKVDTYPAPPSGDNWMGTDESGRDVAARLLYGFFYGITYAVLVWFLSLIIGIVLGGAMGFFGGWFDIIMQRCVEVFSTIPPLFLLLILISIFTPSLLWLIIISTIFGWIGISYYIRAEFLKNRKREYVEAAKALGAGRAKIIFQHILPNSLTPVITFAPFIISGNIIGLASLDYLGFGLPIPTPSWGEMLAQAQRHFSVAWWLAVFPSLAIFVTLTLLNLVGEGIRDAMDPNMT